MLVSRFDLRLHVQRNFIWKVRSVHTQIRVRLYVPQHKANLHKRIHKAASTCKHALAKVKLETFRKIERLQKSERKYFILLSFFMKV